MMQPLVFGLFCGNVCTIINKVIIIIAIIINVSSLTLKTKDISLNLHEDTEIILNCNYVYNKESNEDIGNRNIRWQKQIDDTFEDLVIFSPPGGIQPFIEKEMEASYSNRTKLIAPTKSSFSAVLIIKYIVCEDAGLYQCWVEYYIGNEKRVKTNRSTVAFKVTASTPNYFRVFPNELEENQSLSMSCNADVGNPKGNIMIWRFAKHSNVPALIFTFNASNVKTYKTENCTEIINTTLTYNVSREDNGAFFRCSSQNVLNTGAGPSVDSQRISVSYGPDEPSILLTPNKSSFYVGEDLTLHCQTDSNPPSDFTWSFLTNNDSKDMEKKLLPDNSELILKNIQLNNAGDYTCTVNNGIGTDHRVVSISVRKPLFTCDQCGHTEICLKENGETHCVTNVYMPVAIVFVSLSMTCIALIIFLIKQRPLTQEKQLTTTNPLQLQRLLGHPFHAPADSGEFSSADAIQPTDSLYHELNPGGLSHGAISEGILVIK